ncbi:MAG: hypothetical protein RIR33_1108, partial [Pseudomonadota bacterium]
RMLDMGFVNDIHKLLSAIVRKHQTLFFSATSSPLVTNLSKQAMNKPTIVAVSKRNAVAETIDHVVYPVDDARKYELFVHLLRSQNWYQVMAFSSTREEADKLIAALKLDNVDAAVIHSEKTQGSRRRALQDFKDGKLQVLVATEVAARGLDIQGLDFVVNLNLPFFTEDYVHRIGRTGRAGRDGLAVTFAEFRDRRKIFDIEAYTRQPIKAEVVPGLEPQQRAERPRDFDGPRRGAPGGGRFGGRGAPAGGRSFDRAPRPADSRERNDRPPQVWGAPAAGKPAEGRSFNDRNSRGPRVVGAGDRPERSGPGAGKVFVPRDMKKRPAKGARSDH